MRLVKYLLIIPVAIILLLSGFWCYITYNVANELNIKYAGKKIAVKSFDKSDYFITLYDISPTGFPYKISWNVNGWQEESRSSQITYTSPVKFGYDLVQQKLFISYDGDIIARYKPVTHGFGARLNINNYQINVDVPLSKKLLEEIRSMSNPVQILNHFKNIKISTNKVEIFDLNNNEKFYDKEYERIKISFAPTKIYENINDFINNIPKKYFVDYSVKTLPNNAKPRLLPVSLFYGFLNVPSDCAVNIMAEVNTDSSKIMEFMNAYEVRAKIDGESKYFESKNVDLFYKKNIEENYNKIDISSKLKIKTDFFNQIFDNYDLYVKPMLNNGIGQLINNEFNYVIQNKDLFKFSEMENIDYDFTLKMSAGREKNINRIKIDDLSIFSINSGFKLTNQTEIGVNYSKRILTRGDIFIKNYPDFIEFTSGYIYRFGRFRILNDEARNLYIEVNKAFFKSISDHPQSVSNDLSFNYEFDSNKIDENMFGSAKIIHLSKLYQLMIYQKLFDKVGHGGDVLGRMRKILPQIDGTEPLLSKILPKISDKNIDQDKIKAKIDKVLPQETQKAIKNLIHKNKNSLK